MSFFLFQFFLRAFDLLDALFRFRQRLWHRATQVIDGLADFLPYLIMRLVSALLATHVVPFQFFFSLRSAKQASSVLPIWSRIFWLFFKPLRA